MKSLDQGYEPVVYSDVAIETKDRGSMIEPSYDLANHSRARFETNPRHPTVYTIAPLRVANLPVQNDVLFWLHRIIHLLLLGHILLDECALVSTTTTPPPPQKSPFHWS